MKIYSDDPNLPYKTTKLKALYTKSEIDGLFAKWGVKDVYWRWDLEGNDVYAIFKIKEEIDGYPVNVSARVECPVIWDHKTRAKAEEVNWNISLRVMYWYIKSHLEAAYLPVGFASPPDWLKAYDCLSQGEKMRVDIARALCLNQLQIVFDEFTSVVDREIAKVSAYAISKAVRRSKKKFIAVTCHYDVVDWLDPDWVFCTDTMEFSRKKELGRPLNSKFIGAALPFGKCFGTITI